MNYSKVSQRIILRHLNELLLEWEILEAKFVHKIETNYFQKLIIFVENITFRETMWKPVTRSDCAQAIIQYGA